MPAPKITARTLFVWRRRPSSKGTLMVSVLMFPPLRSFRKAYQIGGRMPCGVGDIRYGETDTSVSMAQSCDRAIGKPKASGESALQLQSRGLRHSPHSKRHIIQCCPTTGKSLRLIRRRVKTSRQKYSSSVFQKHMVYLARPALIKRGASRSSRTLGAGCDGRVGALGRSARMRTAKPCGPGLPTLRSSSQAMTLRATVAIKARTPGRARDKPSNHCAGNAGSFRWTCGD